jgi:hypothetical protein
MRIALLFLGLMLTANAFAVCPICTFAVGAGIGLSQYFGIDDSITGLWCGGLTVSFIIWTINWLDKKNIRFFGRKILIFIGYYILLFIPLFQRHLIGHDLNKLWGLDKIVLGIIIGSIAFYLGSLSYNILKKHHGDRAYFPFQKVVMPVLPLIILSFIFYFITK